MTLFSQRRRLPCFTGLLRGERGSRAFSLVEIALALGIVSFAIIGLVGLLAVSLDSSRASDEDTLVSSMARQVVVELRAIPFDTLGSDTKGASGGGARETFYFDHDARRLTSSQGAVYQCVPVVAADTAYDTQGAAGAAAKSNLYEVQMSFKRAAAPGQAPLQTIHASIARYD